MVRCRPCQSRPVRPPATPTRRRGLRRSRRGAPTPTPPSHGAAVAPHLAPAPRSPRPLAAIGFVLMATGRGGRLAALLAAIRARASSSRWPSATPASSGGASGPPATPSSTAKRWPGSSVAGTRCRRRGQPGAARRSSRTPPTSTSSATPRSRSSPGRCTRRPAAARWRRGCCRSIRPRSPASATVRPPSRSSRPALDFRQDLTLAARATPHDAGQHELGAFVAWAEGDSWLLARPWIPIVAVGARPRSPPAARCSTTPSGSPAPWFADHGDARLAAAGLGADAARGDQRRRRRRARAPRLVGAGAPGRQRSGGRARRSPQAHGRARRRPRPRARCARSSRASRSPTSGSRRGSTCRCRR